MTQLICLSCREIFFQDDAGREKQPHGEVLLTCPYCGSDNVDDLEGDEYGE